MGLYDEASAAAAEMIAEYGISVDLTNPGAGNGTYSPLARTFTPAADATTAVDVVVFDYDEKFVDGSLIKQGDKRVYMSARAGVRPRNGATFPWDGKTLTVMNVKPLQPALVAVLWELQARG